MVAYGSQSRRGAVEHRGCEVVEVGIRARARQSILAEGAIALLVTLSGSALFAS